MQRREFITMIGGAAVVSWPVVVTTAQEIGKTYHIGYLGSGSPVTSGRYAEGFVDALHGLGFVEGKNTIIIYRWAEGKFDRLPVLASELIRERPDVIVGMGGTLVASAIKSATSTLPAVILTDDPVAEGLAASLARPGGNLTGVSVLQDKAELKRIQLLKDMLPHAARIAILRNPSRPNSAVQLDAATKAASSLGLVVTIWEASSTEELDRLLATVSVASVDALLALTDPMLSAQRERIVKFAAEKRLPGSYFWREFVETGGLMSYGPNLINMQRIIASYVAKILKGTKPSDLPIEQPTAFELVINIKTARSLGLVIPPGVLAIADEVIE